ncbi:MAG TPA: hypothetical protein VK658_04670, partial [Chryseolinea sp.]|nr:hypothetical protein [Chryseolinea sp.]
EEQHIHDFIRSAIPKINVRPGNSKAPRGSVCDGFFLAALQLILLYPTRHFCSIATITGILQHADDHLG